MSEIKQSFEGLKIPENWNFPERDKPGINIIHLDLDHNFLSFILPNNPSINPPLVHNWYRGEYRDYFFAPDGKKLHSLSHTGFETRIELVSDNFATYRINEGKSKRDSVDIFFSSSYSEDNNSYLPPNELGQIQYLTGRLQAVFLGKVFATDKEEEIKSPFALVHNLRDVRGLGDGEWIFSQEHESFNSGFLSPRRVSEKENTVGIYILNSKQKEEKVFEVEWKVQRGDREEEKSREYLVVSQTHIPTDIIKTFRAPLSLDMQTVEDAVYSSPPYPKERIAGKDRLVVPWRNIDRIIRARLSYSYPPPQDTSKKQ